MNSIGDTDGDLTAEAMDETRMSSQGGEFGRQAGSSAPLPRGFLIGRYVVLDKLGAGGMGIVYAAYDPELDRKVALKLLHGRLRRRPESSRGHARLLREAQAMAKLNHPNVITVHDVGVHEERVFLAMEFIEGRTLAQHLEQKPDLNWRRILSLFIAAGRGLAAAHKRGLVHRDFKPENVMVGRDGRVRVVDFGLARYESEMSVDDEDGDEPQPRENAMTANLTAAGGVVGTPRYMAPEQHLGLSIDGRSDQFSFFVALWQALYGIPPFAGDNMATLAFNVTEGNIQTPEKSRRVPGWLRKICIRGLSADPEQRFRDMDALLFALRRGHARMRTRRISAGVLGVALLAAGGYAMHSLDERRQENACHELGAEISGVWNEGARDQVRAGLLATKASFAESSATKVIPWLDDWAQSWQRTRQRTCHATRVEERWDTDLAERADSCLDERRIRFESLVSELSTADETATQRAVQAASRLPRAEPCADEHYLKIRPPLPREELEQVRKVQVLMSRAAGMHGAGKYEEGVETANEALEGALELGHAPLIAEARSTLGELLQASGQYEQAEAELTQAYVEAGAAGAQEVVAKSAISLVYTVGHSRARHGEGLVWGRAAEVAVVALGAEAELRSANLYNNLGIIRMTIGDYEEAATLHETATSIWEQELGSNHPDVAMSLNNLANVRRYMGDYSESRTLHERALRARRGALGDSHPLVASSLNNLALTEYVAGDYAAAKPLFEEAIAVKEAALGPEHPRVASSLNNLGSVYQKLEDHEKAKQLFERSLAIKERAYGPEHLRVASSVESIATAWREMGDYERANELYQRALAIRRASLGADHPEIASTLVGLGESHRAAGKLDEARRLLVEALEMRERELESDHPDIAESLTKLGELQLDMSDADGAMGSFERAAEIYAKSELSGAQAAPARFGLARVLVAQGGDRSRARTEANAALASYVAAGDHTRRKREEIQAWLEALEP